MSKGSCQSFGLRTRRLALMKRPFKNWPSSSRAVALRTAGCRRDWPATTWHAKTTKDKNLSSFTLSKKKSAKDGSVQSRVKRVALAWLSNGVQSLFYGLDKRLPDSYNAGLWKYIGLDDMTQFVDWLPFFVFISSNRIFSLISFFFLCVVYHRGIKRRNWANLKTSPVEIRGATIRKWREFDSVVHSIMSSHLFSSNRIHVVLIMNFYFFHDDKSLEIDWGNNVNIKTGPA